ncbi:helix-turn-helix transcriptional regulator [Gorillibacterium massiliense]|uniref:helix-turn-helix transcriptional regulator n=1 Tax=Gorillibacterium massiliense TaxID=1280390 RepID=UPI0004B229BC|nr:AraC family transcriptional regulator [Gorillibacterium massiliense]
MMPFLLAEMTNLDESLPLYVYCIGSHEQKILSRPDGYSAHQLFLTRSGKGLIRIDGMGELVLAPGTAFFLPAHLGHTYQPYHSDEVWDLGFVAFNGSAASALFGQAVKVTCRALPILDMNPLWMQLESIWNLISLNGENAYWEASKRLYSLILAVLENQSSGKRSSERIYPAGQPNSALQTAVKLIHDHYNERLLLSNVARAAGYSVQHFHRLFVAYYGMTPQQYILQLRMRQSLQLMEDQPNITIEKVAQHLGMETSYFIRMFKRTYGSTPKQYKKG